MKQDGGIADLPDHSHVGHEAFPLQLRLRRRGHVVQKQTPGQEVLIEAPSDLPIFGAVQGEGAVGNYPLGEVQQTCLNLGRDNRDEVLFIVPTDVETIESVVFFDVAEEVALEEFAVYLASVIRSAHGTVPAVFERKGNFVCLELGLEALDNGLNRFQT
ncbi:MAG: hypothetical protein UY28_C0004G0060 [Candidatus Amesbacteria bacterium GW2011_GWB1_48_13]|uniref:Uncharacterized protein n=1 Tax=Candidatus Amesbacteria bacterium GW2011_GWB1_48_13 TaxID=1618362 RepID=A0A0G1UVZ6_9BACT|nr:MAG: hypothetical protein UY28_C0004G0060 [Candidatus Amesbacteria bacterium GW2011_GWB1_48_13]